MMPEAGENDGNSILGTHARTNESVPSEKQAPLRAIWCVRAATCQMPNSLLLSGSID